MLICFIEAVNRADELIPLYGRCSPKRLARELDIEVLERDFSKQKGAYKLILKNPFIFIKQMCIRDSLQWVPMTVRMLRYTKR